MSELGKSTGCRGGKAGTELFRGGSGGGGLRSGSAGWGGNTIACTGRLDGRGGLQRVWGACVCAGGVEALGMISVSIFRTA